MLRETPKGALRPAALPSGESAQQTRAICLTVRLPLRFAVPSVGLPAAKTPKSSILDTEAHDNMKCRAWTALILAWPLGWSSTAVSIQQQGCNKPRAGGDTHTRGQHCHTQAAPRQGHCATAAAGPAGAIRQARLLVARTGSAALAFRKLASCAWQRSALALPWQLAAAASGSARAACREAEGSELGNQARLAAQRPRGSFEQAFKRCRG